VPDNTNVLFQNHKYINLTTFRKSGKAVPTPVWFVARDGHFYVYTGDRTGKAKRIRANGRAQIAPSDARGNPLGEFVPARGRQITDPALSREIQAGFQAKYGLQFRLFSLLSTLRRRGMGDPVWLELEPVER